MKAGVATATATAERERLIQRDRDRLIHPHLSPAEEGRMVVAGGDGCVVRDADGHEYLDLTGGGLWANLVGYGRRELAAAAQEELQRLGFFCTYWDFTNAPAIELAARLVEMAPHRIEKVFFTCGGSEGIEVAIKAARLHHHLEGRPEKDWILGRRSSYHGIGHGGSAATDFEWLRNGFGPTLPHFAHLTPPWPYRTELYGGRDPTDFLIDELERTIEELGPERVAAFIGEPVMGVGGLLVPPDDYWPRVAAVLREHGILLILDEVVTGYGRLGDWFAQQHYGVEADIVVTAKGITSGYFPFGAVLVSGPVADRITSGDHGFPLGFTYTGHSAGAAVAMANLDLIEAEGMRVRAPEAGRRLLDALAPLADLPVVGEIRGAGLLAAIELVSDPERREPLPLLDEVTNALRSEHGLIVRAAMNASLVLSPPLVISDAEIAQAASGLGSVLERTTSTGELR